MIKRLSTAAIAVAFAALATTAAAGPYFGYDGRHYGEFASAPNFGRPTKVAAKQDQQDKQEEHHVRGGGNRKGLTPAMLALLQKIENKFGPVNVISGYRPGARIATTGRISRHASGNAVDIDAGSRKGAIVKWLIANHKKGGTMTYADMGHIHVDIGPHFVSLGSSSGRTARAHSYGGRAARYASGYEGRYRRVREASRYYGESGSRSRYYIQSGGGKSRYASGYATIYN